MTMKKLFILGNGMDWCSASLRYFENKKNAYLINEKFPLVSNIKLARIHFSYKLNKIFNIPLKKIWFVNVKNYIINNSSEKDEIVLLVYDWNVFGGEKEFIRYIKSKVRKIKTVYIFTNIVKGSFAYKRNFVHKLNRWYDIIYAFDSEDAKTYHFSYSPLIYDPDSNNRNNEKDRTDDIVFYVGQAKDRIEMLLSCFEKLKELNIKCDFHIANTQKNDIKYMDEIVYNKFMTYSEVEKSIQNSTCLIDVIQGDSTGLTIKVCEAISYQKKLITTNKHLADYLFFDPRYMLIIETADDIKKEFFKKNTNVKYSNEALYFFSGEHFWIRLWSDINEVTSENNF